MDYTWVYVLFQMAFVIPILVVPLWIIKIFAGWVVKSFRDVMKS